MKQLIERVQQWRPVRAWQRYGATNGPVLSQGMTLQAFLSIFAALFVAFAIFMAVLGGNVQLRDAVIESISRSVPGLIGEGAAIDVDSLTGSAIVGWAGAIAAVSIVFTAIAWIGVSREGFRAMFELDDPKASFVLLKLGDLGVAVGIGLLVVVSAGVQVVATALVEAVGLGWAAAVIGILVQLALDTTIVLLLYRFGGRLRLPAKQVVPAALACAVAFFVLKQVATLLFGAVENNPLLAGVAAPVIILIWFGFIMQILLLVLAFVAVGPTGRAYTRLVQAGGIDARLSPEKAQELLDELHASERAGDDQVRLHKRLAKRIR
ncbi:YihY/virulence factor BrkB family protein [Agrococcus carbonis]|uniref:Membrane protein n=1 Tax=Agrococcus carbonis TaxID=684552 RepID=A0A1H1MAW5_9MICO|nr:YihY/virulence factor BrkB family protein [Agrococcus carbonis]SDR83908.1 membrane protein [Agrococcus carbonis]